MEELEYKINNIKQTIHNVQNDISQITKQELLKDTLRSYNSINNRLNSHNSPNTSSKSFYHNKYNHSKDFLDNQIKDLMEENTKLKENINIIHSENLYLKLIFQKIKVKLSSVDTISNSNSKCSKILIEIKETLDLTYIPSKENLSNTMSKLKEEFISKVFKIYNQSIDDKEFNNESENQKIKSTWSWIKQLVHDYNGRNNQENRYKLFCRELMDSMQIESFTEFKSRLRDIIYSSKIGNNWTLRDHGKKIKKILSCSPYGSK